jgi:hypothetical protein
LNKWAIALAAGLIVAVGCSGSGGSSGGSGSGTGGSTTDSSAFVTLPTTYGVLENVYLTGQGRASGDLTAIIRRVAQDDTTGGHVETTLQQAIQLQLNAYTQNTINLNVPTVTSRVFDHYNLEIQQLRVDNGDGTFTDLGSGNQPIVTDTFDAYYRVFPGRTTALSIRLDDSMFDVSNGVAFDRNQFITVNYDSYLGNPPRMNGYLADYVMFDLSNLSAADQPDNPDGSGKANALWVSGDNFAVGEKPDDAAPSTPKNIFVLTPSGYVEGTHVGERIAIDPNTGLTTALPGTYSLIQPDPRPPVNPTSKITALMGPYHPFTKTINSVGTNPQNFELIAFPSSFDDGVDDIVLFNYSNNQVTAIYFGQMDMNASTISAFPVSQISDPSNINNEITGTVTSLLTAGGSPTTDVTQVRSGHYTLNAAGLPATFSTSGRFVVYRR